MVPTQRLLRVRFSAGGQDPAMGRGEAMGANRSLVKLGGFSLKEFAYFQLQFQVVLL